MDWLVFLFILIAVVMNIWQKIAKEAARQPYPSRPPGPSPSPPSPGGTGEEGIYRETPSPSMEEGEGGSTEGVSLEGDFTPAEPPLMPEILQEQEELTREREAFYREAMALLREEDGEGEDLFPERPVLPHGLPRAERSLAGGGGWFSTPEDLVRAMVALEVFGPPGGHRLNVLRGGQKLHGT